MNTTTFTWTSLAFLTLLITGSIASSIRCYELNGVKKCALPLSKDKKPLENDPKNLDLKLDTTLGTTTYLFSIKITNAAESGMPPQAQTSADLLNLSTWADPTNLSFEQATEQKFIGECPNCLDAAGNLDSSKCLFTEQDLKFKSSSLDVFKMNKKVRFRFLVCEMDPKVVISLDSAAQKCPKSIVSLETHKTSLRVFEQNTMRLGLAAIDVCINAKGQDTYESFIISTDGTAKGLIMNTCESEMREYVDQMRQEIQTDVLVAKGKSLNGDKIYRVGDTEQYYPFASPAFFESLGCAKPLKGSDRIFSLQFKLNQFEPVLTNKELPAKGKLLETNVYEHRKWGYRNRVLV